MDSHTFLSLTLPRDRRAAAIARRELAAASLPGGANTARATALLATELINNAVMHGDGEEIEVLVTGVAERLRLEVRDGGNGFDPARRSEREDPGGWGLAIVEQLADDWGVYEGSTHVWFELRI
jgi:anti-sigma regulatory factor (Ser/Thr protein kinase)